MPKVVPDPSQLQVDATGYEHLARYNVHLHPIIEIEYYVHYVNSTGCFVHTIQGIKHEAVVPYQTGALKNVICRNNVFQ